MVCQKLQDSFSNEITPATNTCDGGDFLISGVLTYPRFIIFLTFAPPSTYKGFIA